MGVRRGLSVVRSSGSVPKAALSAADSGKIFSARVSLGTFALRGVANGLGNVNLLLCVCDESIV